MRILNPYFRILLREFCLHDGILHEHGRMLLHVLLDNHALVEHKVLQGERRGNHLGGGAVVVEFTSFKG